MQSVIGFEDKVKTLKCLEAYCYQIAYYLLQDEALAADAAMKALIRLYQSADFFEKTTDVQRNLTKIMTIRTSLQSKLRLS